ncbi:MAG: TniB family NTP-binding protein [Cellvibrio sp.]|nr:TniB family NTP-binding protein [Cellvibrio sp.]
MRLSEEHLKKIAMIKNLVINHSQFDMAYRKMLDAYQLNIKVGIPQHIICVGQSGTGKSTLKEKIKANFPRREENSKTITPILIIDTPPIPTIKNLAEEMLIQLGDSRFHIGSAVQKTSRVLNFLEHCEVKMIIFDELQHFIDQGRKRAPQDVSDWLKTVIDKSKTSIILMGLERCDQLLRINEQLRRRFSRRIDISPFSMNNQKDFEEFIGVICTLDEKIGLPDRINLFNKDLMVALFYATNGVIDCIVKLFIGAYEVAIAQRKHTLDAACFEIAFTENVWIDGVGKLNPFNKKFIWENLDKPGMPFHRMDSVLVERLSK